MTYDPGVRVIDQGRPFLKNQKILSGLGLLRRKKAKEDVGRRSEEAAKPWPPFPASLEAEVRLRTALRPPTGCPLRLHIWCCGEVRVPDPQNYSD